MKFYLYENIVLQVNRIMEETKKYYRHFKGGKYMVLMEGTDSESLTPVVIYRALYGEQGVWVRPKEMFYGTVVRDGIERPRFKEISEEEALSND